MHEDESVHMVKRRTLELQRQKRAVVLKERLYGRSMESLEGGPEFEVRRTRWADWTLLGPS